ncbi:hypothetical protein LOK49_LG01G01569 [Camellia lanceoleosa]|uniref:Uncharacterized protein n=1 Tax=Camellia lanceoleosa TaxID=1840588 RepID=A0ACC0IZ95_9ERIC|nr:hypothetical protein LOK49_LG01G01569 [Camellia lanceoleosa]
MASIDSLVVGARTCRPMRFSHGGRHGRTSP